MKPATEERAANLLLERGVAVQVAAPFLLRLAGRKTIRMEVRAPRVKELLKIAQIFLQLGIANSGDMTLQEAFALYSNGGRKMSEAIALCIRGSWHYRLRAAVLRHNMTEKEMSYLFHLIIAYGGIEDFINTIRLAEATRITKPMNLSQKEKMS